MQQMAGKFITFEGGEGAGKSTQVRRLAGRLTDRGLTVATTREPGGTPTAEAIRRAVLSGQIRQLGADAEAILFAAARADHIDHLIQPALACGEWVLCDRFADSTRVYQGTIGGVDGKLIRALERIAVGHTKPDLTVILDVPAEIGLARVNDRLAASGELADRFESDGLDLHERRRQAYLEIAEAEPDRCRLVDATQPEEVVADAIWEAVQTRFGSEAA